MKEAKRFRFTCICKVFKSLYFFSLSPLILLCELSKPIRLFPEEEEEGELLHVTLSLLLVL